MRRLALDAFVCWSRHLHPPRSGVSHTGYAWCAYICSNIWEVTVIERRPAKRQQAKTFTDGKTQAGEHADQQECACELPLCYIYPSLHR